MKLKTLIKHLQKLEKQGHGELPVVLDDGCNESHPLKRAMIQIDPTGGDLNKRGVVIWIDEL